MRVNGDKDVDSMSVEEVVERLTMLNEKKDGENEEEMKERLKVMERTRHLMVWHDLSTVANHFHLVFMATCLYDQATFYTGSEYEVITGRKVNIQSLVEAPSLYLVARSSSRDQDQLCYVETRLECLQELSKPISMASGTPVADRMRFFHGDSPSRQYEAGQQKGGGFYCALCGANAQRVYELDYVFRCPHVSLEDRQQLILRGPCGKANSIAKSNKPLQGLTKQNLIRELNARSIYDGEKKRELEEILKTELHGVQRVPALLFPNPSENLESINCANYEILGFEPLHDIGKHIENLFTELPDHLPSNEASKLKTVLDLCIGAKETKRTIDYRCALIVVSNNLRGSVNSMVQQLLDTLVEIQEIAYSLEAMRTPRSVLRLHNLTWQHAILCQSVMGFSLKQMTTRKFYGNYFHNITAHAPIQQRLISGRSANTEEQERVFNSINNITRTTSSNHADHIIGNVFIRIHAEKEFKADQSVTSDAQEAQVSKLASSLPDFGNTVIPKQMLVRNARPWQAHLERICDFLLVGEGIWWRRCQNGDIEFLDAKGNPETSPHGPTVHHFRSSNFKKEEAYLKHCWESCLKKKIKLPIEVLQAENAEGNMVFVETNKSEESTSSEIEGQVCEVQGGVVIDDVGIVGGVDDVAIVDDADQGCIEGVSESVIDCEIVASCKNIVQSDWDEALQAAGNSGTSYVVEGATECNARLVEISEDVVCFGNHIDDEENAQENGETSTSEATNRNKGTFFQDLVFCQINVWVYTFRQRFPISSSSYIA